jgi:hypothetical protein
VAIPSSEGKQTSVRSRAVRSEKDLGLITWAYFYYTALCRSLRAFRCFLLALIKVL